MGRLGTNPDRDSIMAEFGSNTRPSNGGLEEAWGLIFGGTNYSRDGFYDVGYPDGSITPGTSTTQTSATLEGNIVDMGLDTEYRFEWGDGNYNNTTTWKTVIGNTGDTTVSENISGLSAGTTYDYRLVYYNPFNSNSSDWEYSSGQFTTQSPPADQGIFLTQAQDENPPVQVEASWTNLSSSYPSQVEFEEGGYSHFKSVSAGVTSVLSNAIYYQSDSVRARVRHTSGPNTSWSDWSNNVNILTST